MAGQARAVGNLGLVRQGQCRYDESLSSHRLAIRLFHDVGDRTGEARGYGNAGYSCINGHRIIII